MQGRQKWDALWDSCVGTGLPPFSLGDLKDSPILTKLLGSRGTELRHWGGGVTGEYREGLASWKEHPCLHQGAGV